MNRMLARDIRHLPIADEEGEIIGMLSIKGKSMPDTARHGSCPLQPPAGPQTLSRRSPRGSSRLSRSLRSSMLARALSFRTEVPAKCCRLVHGAPLAR